MHRFKKIGIIFDLETTNSELIAHAKELIETNQAKIHIICIIPNEIGQDDQKVIHSAIKDKVGFNFELVLLTDKAIIDITKYTIKNNLDLILVEPEQDEEQINDFFQGSLILSLMRKVPCPIWVVKKPVTETYQRIAISVDPKIGLEENSDKSLNKKLIEIGTSYARRQSAECHLVTAWHLEGEGILRGPFVNTQSAKIKELKDDEKAYCEKAFKNLQETYSKELEGCHMHMLYGNPGKAIAKFVIDNKIDLIVIGTLARSGIPGFLIGNTAESVINQVDCSIMAIKPEGFVSPITF